MNTSLDNLTEFLSPANINRSKSLLSIAFGWSILVGSRTVYPVLVPYFILEFDISLKTAGLLITILWLGSGIGQLPGGILADKYSERIIMSSSLLLAGALFIILANIQSSIMFILATGFLGLANSLYPIARITVISDLYPDGLGGALGIVMAFGDIGQTILPAVAGLLAAVIAWQMGLGFVVPLFLVAAVGIWINVPSEVIKSSHDSLRSKEYLNQLTNELRDPKLIYVGIVLILFFITWQSFTAFFPTYLVEIKGMSLQISSLIFSLFFAMGVIIKPMAGIAYDRIGLRRSLIFIHLLPAIGLIILPYIQNLYSIILMTAIISIVLGSGAVTQAYLADAFSSPIKGTGLGIVRTFSLLVGSTGPVFFGVVADSGYFDEAYLGLAVALIIAVLITMLIPPKMNH